MQPDRQAAIAVIVQSGRFLVIERSQKVRAPGKLCFPGGEVEDADDRVRGSHEHLLALK